MIRGSPLFKVFLPLIILVFDVVGIMRRGCMIEALRKFIISQGPSKNINNLEWASFWAENKKVIDPVAKRFSCISAKQRYLCSYLDCNDIVCSLLLFMEMVSLEFLKSKRFLVTKRI